MYVYGYKRTLKLKIDYALLSTNDKMYPLLRSNLWSSQFVTVSQFVTESVAICDGCRNLWRKVSQFVTTSKYAI